MRSGQCQSIINEVVYEGQLVKKNKFTGEYIFDEDAKKSDKIIGFMAYFRLTNGFEKYDYMSVEEVKQHAQKFSQTFRKGSGIWKDHFEAMGCKTVLKRLLTKYAPKSIEMQQIAMFDQNVVSGDINNLETATTRVEPTTNANVEDVEFTEAEEVVEETPKETSTPTPTVETEKSFDDF